MNGPDRRRLWPLLAGAFTSGLTVALLLPAPGSKAEDRPATPADAPTHHQDPSPGPTAVLDGVSAGFARTEAGAVAAAVSFVCTGQALLNMDPLAAEQAIRRLSAEASADELVRRHLTQLDSARDVLSAGTGPIIYRQGALASRVEAYDDSRARISVWSVGVLSRDGVAPPQAGWSTSVVDLVWEQDDWKVWGETITPGPTPIADDSDAPATSAAFASELAGFTDLGGRP